MIISLLLLCSGGIKLPSLSVLKRNRASSKAAEVKKEAAAAASTAAAGEQNSGKVERKLKERLSDF